MKAYDVIVAGGGPAACALAMYTDPKVRVLVVDKRRLLDGLHLYENEKCCGGMLDETALRTLARMSLPLDREILAEPSVFKVRAVDYDNRMERTYARNYLNIDRIRFDRMLLRKAASRSNVEVREGTCVQDLKTEGDGVIVTLRTADGQVQQVQASLLVGADGASSLVSRKLKEQTGKGPKRPPRVYASLQEWFDTDRPLPYYMAMFDRKVTDYYSWVIPKKVEGKDQLLVGTAIPLDRPDKALTNHQRFDRIKADLAETGLDLSQSSKKLGAWILRPRMFGSVWTGDDRVFLTGEAAGLISPSSSEGISFALRSGMALGKCLTRRSLNRAESGKRIRSRYEARLLSLKLAIAVKSVKAPLMYNQWLRGLIFLSGLTSIPSPEERV